MLQIARIKSKQFLTNYQIYNGASNKALQS